MNLIEQLGGYYQAKNWLDRNEIHVKHGYLEKYRAELLQHRRQHNIFEAGDRIVKASRLNDDKVYLVLEVAGSLNWVKTSCGDFIDVPMFKHATDEEIKAGHRL